MSHIWTAELLASKVVRSASPEATEEALELLLDDRDTFSGVAKALGLSEALAPGPLELSRWLGSLERTPSAAARAEVMGLVGLSADGYADFVRSPCQLPAEVLERGAMYWALHNLLAPPEDLLWAASLELRVTPDGANGPPLIERAYPRAFALRLLVDLGVAAGSEPESGPIIDYFRGHEATWPELGVSEDEVDGIVWWAAIRAAEGPEPAWIVEAVIHPHWLPAITHAPFRSWAY
jgi:hypothetical protein